MRKNLLLLLIGFLLIGSLTAKAAEYEYSYTFTKKVYDDVGTQALNGVNWTLAVVWKETPGTYNYDGNNGRGQQIGSENNPATSATLSTSGIVGTITSVKVNASGANGTNATMSITVGGENFTNNSSSSVSLTSTATEYTFTGEQSGDIVISLSQTSSKALYIKSITVSYYDFVTVNSIAAFKALATNTEAELVFCDAANARITFVNNKEVFLRDNTGAICLYNNNMFTPSRPWAYNQHVAGTLIGKYTLYNGLPQLQATANTNTDNLIIADRVSEDMVMPKKIEASAYDANLADWVKVENLVKGTSDIEAYDKYSSAYFQMPHNGARYDLSGIAVPYNSTKQIAPIYQNSVRPLVYVIDENKTFVSPASDIQNATVRLVRTLSSEYWNTFAVPFNFSFDETEALIREYDNISGTTMLFKEAESIEAGKPYLIIPDETIANPVFYDVTLSATPAQTVTYDDGAYSFVAIYSPYAMALDQTELYLGDGDLLYYPVDNTSNTMRGMRAFYRVPIGGAKVAIYGEDYEDTDGIRSIENGEGRIENGEGRIENYDYYYNLSGQRVGKDYKGIVIRNGKKYITK